MTWIALDIGGANIKVADGVDFARIVPFELWRKSEQLADKLLSILSNQPQAKQVAVTKLAVTMTGELADCFATRNLGVRFILDAVSQASSSLGIQQMVVYLTSGEMVSLAEAYGNPAAVAAANWHALASFAGNSTDNDALLIDLGSTTCDIIPLVNGTPQPTALTDTERLIAGELVYTGVQRTPVYGITHSVPFRSRRCPLASEWFATSLDVYLQLGELPEEPSVRNTADSQPATIQCAKNRLARSLCLDADDFTVEDAQQVALFIQQAQCSKIAVAIRNVIRRMKHEPKTIITSGMGEFLIHQVLKQIDSQAEVISLNEKLGSTISTCATAHGLGYLARLKQEHRVT